jgi:hypothetical protein
MAAQGMATIRESMLRQLHLPASVGAQLGIVPDQWTTLRRGAPVVLTREQLAMFGHPSMPANLADHASWTLSGDNTLTPG